LELNSFISVLCNKTKYQLGTGNTAFLPPLPIEVLGSVLLLYGLSGRAV